jgi:hypothetical protein
VIQICLSLLFHMDDRYHLPANVLGDHGVIPKGEGEFWGIGLLEQIEKVLEKVMDLRLEAIVFHNSLHRCLAFWGMGTRIIEAKLAQQLSPLEQTPFFGIFIDLQPAEGI